MDMDDSGMDTTANLNSLPISPRAEKVLEKARELALQYNHAAVTSAHLALALLGSDSGSHHNFLSRTGFNRPACETELILRLVRAGGAAGKSAASTIFYSESALEILAAADRERREAKQVFLGTQHLLLALLRGGSPVARILGRHGLDYLKAKPSMIPFAAAYEHGSPPARHSVEAV